MQPLCPLGEQRGKCISQGGRAEPMARGSRRGWDALGMPSVPCSEGRCTAQPPLTLSPAWGLSGELLLCPFTGVSVRCHTQGLSSLPPSPSAPALSLSELSPGMKAGTDSTLTPSLTHPDLALVTPVLSETLIPLSPCPCPPHPLCAAGSSVQLLPTPALTLPAPAS